MSKTFQRSIRIDNEYLPIVEAIPDGAGNIFFNELIRAFRDEPAVRAQVLAASSKFRGWDGDPVQAEMSAAMEVSQPPAPPLREDLPMSEIERKVAEAEPAQVIEYSNNEERDAIFAASKRLQEKNRAEIETLLPDVDKAVEAFNDIEQTEQPVEKPVGVVQKRSALDDLFAGM